VRRQLFLESFAVVSGGPFGGLISRSRSDSGERGAAGPVGLSHDLIRINATPASSGDHFIPKDPTCPTFATLLSQSGRTNFGKAGRLDSYDFDLTFAVRNHCLRFANFKSGGARDHT